MRLSGHILDIELLKAGTVHKFSPAGATARNALPIGLGHDGRRIVRIMATAAVNFIFGGPTVEAAATDTYLPAGVVEYFDMWGNTYIAAYGTADVYVTEMDITSEGGGRWEAPVLETGQTTQYSSKEDDGYYEKGVLKDYTVLSTGDYAGTSAIVLNGKTHNLSNNCVQDNQTGLMWARYVPTADIGPDSDGKLLGVDDTNDEDIFDFVDQANTNELGGHSDWRVPNVLELLSLMDAEAYSPAIDTTTFPSTPAGPHWTSTSHKGGTTYGVHVDFVYGWLTNVTLKTTSKQYCRLVRGGG